MLGDGGIYSSIDDLAQVGCRALRRAPAAQPVDWKQAFTPATEDRRPDVEYGFGWRITGETLWHSGETVGFRNVIVRYPQRHLTVVVLTNRNDPEPYAMAKKIAALLSSTERTRNVERRRAVTARASSVKCHHSIG